MSTVVFTGDTIRVQASFRDWSPDGVSGALVDPDSNVASVAVFDSELTSVSTGTATRQSVGVYTYDWTVPVTEGTYFFEFKGLFSTKPQLTRQKFSVKFKPSS